MLKDKRKLSAALAIVFAINIVIILLVQTFGSAASWKKGMSGETVTKIQERLSQWGYYSGDIDGIYGSRTEKAVKKFQKSNGLTADGIAGPATLAAIGISDGSGSSGTAAQSNDIALLARLISAEERDVV